MADFFTGYNAASFGGHSLVVDYIREKCMDITDLTRDVKTLLLSQWTKDEINSRLENPDYFFEQVVIPRLDYLRKRNEEIPILRLKRGPKGEFLVFLNR